MRGFMRTEAMEFKSSSDSKSKCVSQSEILGSFNKRIFYNVSDMEYAMKLNWAKRICNIHFKLVDFGLVVGRPTPLLSYLLVIYQRNKVNWRLDSILL